MKKLIALPICLLIAASTFVFADGEPFANAGEIYQSWYQTNGPDLPYPEYVTGAWSTDGSSENMTFAIMKGFEDQANAEILDRIADKDSVSFAEGGKYTMARLKEAQNYIGSKMSEGAGSYPIWGCGIDDMENAVVCDINTSNDKAQAVMDELSEKFGDMIKFNESSAVAVYETAENELSNEKKPVADTIAYILIGIGAAAIIASVLLLKKKKASMQKKK